MPKLPLNSSSSSFYSTSSPSSLSLSLKSSILYSISLLLLLLLLPNVAHSASGRGGANNQPPRFKSSDDTSDFDLQSEIVVRVKEGASSLNKEIFHLYGEDADGDSLQFGVLGTLGKDLLRIDSISPTEAKITLKKELDREIQDSYTLVLTLTDGKLGKGNYVRLWGLDA